MIEYTPENWLAVSFSLRGSVIPRIAVRTVVTTVIGLGAAYLRMRYNFGIPTLLHTLVGVVLGLLLVFRTNASYDRWWEGRKFLGNIVNSSRDLMRQICSWIPHDQVDGKESERSRLTRYLGAMYRLEVQALRDEDALDAVSPWLRPDEIAHLQERGFRPNVIATWISQRLAAYCRRGELPPPLLASMDRNLTEINDAQGACQRILHTPMPLAYAQHSKLFVSLFCFTVPFAISESMGWFTPFAAALLCFAFFGIDEIGVEIEDPFGLDPNDLPMEDIGDSIDASTLEIADAAASFSTEAPVAERLTATRGLG